MTKRGPIQKAKTLYRIATTWLHHQLMSPGPGGSTKRKIREVKRKIRKLGLDRSPGNSMLKGYTYHPIRFEGFGGIGVHRADCEGRLRAILGALPLRPGDWILDVGANVGFFSFGLEEVGAMVEAYESDSKTFEIGAALSSIHDRNVIYVNKPVSRKNLALLRPRYRAVLLMSVFHWIVAAEGFAGGQQILQDLSRRSDYIFMEAPSQSGDACSENPIFASPEATETFLRNSLPGARISRIHHDEKWHNRILWMIERRRQ